MTSFVQEENLVSLPVMATLVVGPGLVAMIARSLDPHQHCESWVGIQRGWKAEGGERKRTGVVVQLVEIVEGAQNMTMRLLRLLLRLPPVEADAGQQQDR